MLDFNVPSSGGVDLITFQSQTVSCTFASYLAQSNRELYIFLTGIFFTLGVSFLIEAIAPDRKKGDNKKIKYPQLIGDDF